MAEYDALIVFLLAAVLMISVHSGTSLALWTFISGQQKAKTSIFGQIRRLKVHNMNLK